MSYMSGGGKLKEGADWLISQVKKMNPSAVGGTPSAAPASAPKGAKGAAPPKAESPAADED
jgi:hypothetical protein